LYYINERRPRSKQRAEIGRSKLLGHQIPQTGCKVCDDRRIRNIGMGVVIAVILADLLIFLLYIYQYRQELGLAVNGSHDAPVLRKKPAKKEPAKKEIARTGAAAGQANRGQRIVAKP
jgi:hypothetical protein